MTAKANGSNGGDVLGDISSAAVAERKTVVIEMPIGDSVEHDGYQKELVEGGDVSIEQESGGLYLKLQVGPKAAAAFVRIRDGLRASGATVPDGRGRGEVSRRPVWTNADALRWILNTIADAAE